MTLQQQKAEIIQLINSTSEVSILEAVKQLLQQDTTITESEKLLLDERIAMIEEGRATYVKWGDVKDSL